MTKLCCLFIPVLMLLANNQLMAQCQVKISTGANSTQLDCNHKTITLTADTSGTQTQSVSYLWSTGETSSSINITTPGTYTVVINDDNLCTTSSSIIITQDIAVPNVSALALTDSVCSGGSSTLIGVGAVTYYWETDIQPAPFFIVHPQITTTYTVTGAAANGCIAKDTVEVAVFKSPTASITGTTSFCQNAEQPPITFTGMDGKAPYTFVYNVFHFISGPTQTVTTTGTNNAVVIKAPTTELGTLNYALLSVIDSRGCTQLQSDTANIYVFPRPLFSSPKVKSVCDNAPFVYTATSSVPVTAFSWVRPVVNGISNAAGHDSSAFINETFHNITLQPIEVKYFFSIYSGFGCETHDTLTVTVNPTPDIKPVRDTVFCNGVFVNNGILFSSSSPNPSFAWKNDLPSIGLPDSGKGNILPFNASNSKNTNVSATITISVKASADGCPGTADSSFKITVLPAPVLLSANAATICNKMPFQYTARSSIQSTIFSWTRPLVSGIKNSPGFGNDASVNDTLENTTFKPLVVKYYFTLFAGTGCVVTDSVLVTVNPTPPIDTVASKPYCNGDFVRNGIQFGSLAPDASFSWSNDNTAIGLASKGTGNILPFNITNTTENPITATITVVAYIKSGNDSCAGASTTFTITALPAPVLRDPKTDVVCDTVPFIFTAKSSANATNYRWTRDSTPGIINRPDSGSTEVVNEKLDNILSIPVVVKYNFYLFTGNSCVTADSVKITVNPTPQITQVNDTTFCNGVFASNGIRFAADFSGATFTWTNDNPAIGLPASGTGNILPFIAKDTTDKAIKANIKVSSFINTGSRNCLGTSTNFTITVNPSPPKPAFTSFFRYADNDTLKVCTGAQNINFNANSPAPATTYLWTVAPNNSGVVIRDIDDVNTVISFRTTNTDTIKLTATNSIGGCTNVASQIVKVTPDLTGIDNRKILPMQPGNLLIYPNNSLTSYQWGYDPVIRPLPDRAFGASVPIEGQVYQFFIPDTGFISKTTKLLDTTNFAFWILLRNVDCYTKIYYNGPYANNRVIETPPVESTVKLQLIPNPNKGLFEISLRGNIYGDINAQIYNSLGQVVFRKSFVKNSPAILEKINTSNLPPGAYFLILHSSDLKKVISRFVIQH